MPFTDYIMDISLSQLIPFLIGASLESTCCLPAQVDRKDAEIRDLHTSVMYDFLPMLKNKPSDTRVVHLSKIFFYLHITVF